MISKLITVWQFSRPHTIIGTTLSITALYIIALSEQDFIHIHPVNFLLTLISCLAGNIYIVGLNQLQDIEIDRINKPDLPLVSDRLSPKTGMLIVILSGTISIILAISLGVYLTLVVIISLILGTFYSLPPIRLKRFPFWASFSIFVVRGLVINLGIYLHFRFILTDSQIITAKVWVLTTFIFGFSLVIAWFKDLPDTKGDRFYKIKTFALHFGRNAVYRSGIVLLSFLYLGLIISGILILPEVNNLILIVSHLVILGILLFRSFRVNPHDNPQIVRFYHFIWKLFYVEYIIYPIACVFA